ncbi:hypothetical protein D1007_39646 [Hordeum vulgare]|nr:hypothetical protein D1007_39646 [Hordeum vulgare]
MGPTGRRSHLAPKSQIHSPDAARMFIVWVEGTPCSWLRLLDFFTEEMEDLMPLGMWLQLDGYCNGPRWVATEFNTLGFLFMRSGWKSFALTQGLRDGHVLHFEFDGAATLFVKVF